MNTATKEEPRYLTTTAARNFLNLGQSRFIKFVYEFNVPICTHAGAKHLFDRCDLLKAVEASKRAPQEAAPVAETEECRSAAQAILQG